METAGLKKLAEDKRQAVHPQLSQCQLSRDDDDVRKNASRGGNKVTLPRDVLEPLPSAGLLFAYESAPTSHKGMSWAPKLTSPIGKTRLREALHEKGQVRVPVLPASLPSGFLPSST